MRLRSSAATRFLFVGLLLTALSAPATRMAAAPQTRLLFGAERFERTAGAPNVFRREFSVPSSIGSPFVLTVRNGHAGGVGRGAIKGAITAGRITLNGVEVVSPSDFSLRVGTIEKYIVPSASNVLEVTLASAPGSFISVSITGVLDLEDLTDARRGHTATVLADGSVLIAGGEASGGIVTSVERFVPATRTFTREEASFVVGRAHHTASVLPDGRHLVTSGSDNVNTVGSNELFDSDSGLFMTLPASLLELRAGHTATVLHDGRVLIAGGRQPAALGSTEAFDGQFATLFKPRFDSGGGQFLSLSSQLVEPRSDHTATLLPDGRVLIAGGQNDSGFLTSVEVFDPAANAFVLLAATLPVARAGHSATLLPDGRVLLLGGRNTSGYLDAALVFDPATNSFAEAQERLALPRAHHTATLLYYGEILIAGGDTAAGPSAHTEFVKPAASDTLAPRALHFHPGRHDTGVDLHEIITVRFSEPVDVTSVHAGTVSVEGAAAVPVEMAMSEDGLLLFVLPTSPLAAGTEYIFRLTSGITDTSGNPLEAESVSFTTVAAPVIDALEPPAGPAGSELSLFGSNFDPAAARNLVTFGGMPALVAGATAAQIDTTVPADALAGEMAVTVTTRGGSAAAPFTVTNVVPVIDALEPDTVIAGSDTQRVAIMGAGFALGAHVNFGGAILLPSLRTPTRVEVDVPASLLTSIGTTEVAVTNPAPGGGASNALTFTVRGVRITGFAPTSGAPGTTVTISGEGFDPVAANNQVSFNGTMANVTTATGSTIEAIVPPGSSSGPITVVTPIGQAHSEPFTVTSAATLLLSRVPDQAVYAPGAPIAIHTLVIDPAGRLVPGVDVELTSSPEAGERAGNIFRYFSDGIYTITARAIVDETGASITASTQVRIDSQTVSIACDAPADGGIITALPGGAMMVSGSVHIPDGITELTVNGLPVSVDATGAFTTAVTTVWGVNLVKLAATSTSGQQTRRTCAFLLSENWAPDTQTLSDVVSLRQTQAVIDDGSRSGAINSVADILHAVLNSAGLRSTVHNTMLAANPLKTGCDQRVFGICVMSSDVRYLDSQFNGPNTVSLGLVTGGVRSTGRVENMRFRVRVRGQVAGIPYDTIGFVSFAHVEVSVIQNVTVSGGRARVSVRPGTTSVAVGTITTNFSGLDGFIINLLNTLFNGTVRDLVAGLIRDYVATEFSHVLDQVLGSLEPENLTAVNEVRRLDDTGTLRIDGASSVSAVQTSASRMLIGMGLRATSPLSHARPTLGSAVPPGPRLFDAPGAPLANAMHVGFLNQGLHALWRGGYFDVTLGEGMLDGTIPAGVTLTTSAALSPAAIAHEPDRVALAMGAVRIQLSHPALGHPVSGTLGGRISCGILLEAELLRLDACTVDDLDFVTTAPLTASEEADVQQLLGDTLRAILVRASQGAVPASPILSFRIPDSLGSYGLPVGARLGVTHPMLRHSGNHLVIEGGFGIR
jgi:hypothetical protein